MKISYLLMIFLLAACSPQVETTEEAQNTTETTLPAAAELAGSTPIVKECSLLLGFDAWEPYQYADVGGRVAGLDIELVSLVANGIGCEITYRQGTWVDLLGSLKEGDIDILLGASKTPAREKFAFFSEPYRMEEFSLYIRSGEQDDLDFTTLTEFVNSGSKVGVVAEYLYGEEVARLVDHPETSKMFVNAIMGELNVARLMDGDIDGFLEDSFVGASMLRRKALSDYIIAQGITIETGNAYVMFSQESVTPEQLVAFNAELKRVKASDDYEELMAKYSY
jgi:polar amino acid transport system substrate-binding protein